MSLTEYHKKRNFQKTKEPSGHEDKNANHIFVIQKHYASHLHYDFRLELDGVLKSWAVPKGPPKTMKEKRLAVEVEDHPVSYAKFEGTIPKGEYGAGTVEIWDKGTWEPLGNPQQQLKKGHLDFELKGKRLSGRWMLIRTQMKAKKANWLLMKRSEAINLKKKLKVKKVDLKKIHPSKIPDFVEPELCTLVDKAPTGTEWIHEIKFDGYRSFCRKENSKLNILTRSGLDWTKKYHALAKELKKIKAKSMLLDGEIAWVDEKGKTQFSGLQDALKENRSEDLVYYVFDLLFLNGKDLRNIPLIERKDLLATLLKSANSKKIIFSDHQLANGHQVFKSACHLGLEGIISKNANSTYLSGRGSDWQKIKCTHAQEFVIGGFSLQRQSKNIGSLLLGEFDSNQKLNYVGRVGTGFNQKNLPTLLTKMKTLKSQYNPFSTKPSLANSVQWVQPELVAQVEFGAWTKDHILRHAAFKGLREDKPARLVDAEIQITHPDKIIFKKEKIKKIDLINYYKKIQKWILPHIINRPLSLLRCPSGEDKTCFFQKHLEDDKQSISVKNLSELLQLIQINTLELHVQNCHVNDMHHPDLIVFDLDPDPTVGWTQVKKAAFDLKKILDRLKLKNFLKVSGNKGLHIHVPIAPIYTWDEVKSFAKSICDHLVSEQPEHYTTQLLKKNRKNKIFLDYLRNGEGATAILPFSLRKTPQASVALPISWSDLSKLKAPNTFTLKKTEKLLIATKKDPWQGYFKTKQKIKILDQSRKN